MVVTDEEIALKLIDALERLVLESSVLEILLDELTGSQQWRKRLDKIMSDPQRLEKVHAKLLPLREQVLDAPDLTAAVRHMLEGLERIDPEEKGNQ
ncbi:MAG: hypothetical protein ACHP8B_04610 [Terriglobales bacterium]